MPGRDRTVACSCAFLLVSLIPLAVSTREPAPAAALVCEDGTRLFFHGGPMRQGVLRLAELQLGPEAEAAQAAWGKQNLYFWPDPADAKTLYALAAVDLALEPSLSRLSLVTRQIDGQTRVCTERLGVEPGEFAEDHLRVDNNFVELSKENQDRVKSESELVQRVLSTVTPERLWGGPFHAPLKRMEPRGNFGRRRVFNGKPRAPHTGEDLRGRTGTPVYAAGAGRVVLARQLFFGGNIVILDHGLGLYTSYAHLNSFDVEEGDTVKAGDQVGRVGSTGRVTGPHLHWSARIGDARFNPMELLSLALPD